MDTEAFRRFLLVTKRWAPTTVRVTMKRLAFATRLGLPVDTFTVEGAETFLATRRDAGASVNAWNNDVKLLKALAEWQGLDASRFRFQERRAQPFRALSAHEVRRLLSYEHPGDRTVRLRRRAMILWALKSGMRVSEAAALQMADLDVPRRRFFVRRPAKRGSQRWLPIEPWVYSEKRPMLAWLKERARLHPTSSSVWVSSSGPCSSDFLRREMHDVGRITGVPVSFTITRHTRATELLRAGWDIRYIQVYLGHADIGSTQIYAEAHPEDTVDLMRRRAPKDPWGGTLS